MADFSTQNHLSAKDKKKLFADIIELRESMYDIALQSIKGKKINQKQMALLNQWLLEANQSVKIKRNNDGAFVQIYRDSNVKVIVFPLVHSFIDLLTHDNLMKIRQCIGDSCEWLFLDKTKNKSRQWCSMEGCGNRERAKRFYHAKKSQW